MAGHEIAHAILHRNGRSSPEHEVQADQAGLFALWKWIRPRDLTALVPDGSPGLYDHVSALTGMMMLMTAGALQEGASTDIEPELDCATTIRRNRRGRTARRCDTEFRS